jgi:hypothetical protein
VKICRSVGDVDFLIEGINLKFIDVRVYANNEQIHEFNVIYERLSSSLLK